MSRKQLLGVVGSLTLFIGTFMPIVQLPIVGSMNYFQNGRGDGVIIVLFAAASLIATWQKGYRFLWVTGVGSLALLAYTFVSLQSRLHDATREMEKGLEGNPFRGIGDAMIQSVQLQWGWAVLVVGAGLVIASAAIRDDTPSGSLQFAAQNCDELGVEHSFYDRGQGFIGCRNCSMIRKVEP